MYLAGLFLFITRPIAVSAQVQTGYIDDEYGDPRTSLVPLYSGPGSGTFDWLQAANFSSQFVAAYGDGFDVQRAFNQTWHWTEFFRLDNLRTVTFSFTGTSLNVYCILPNPVTSPSNVTNEFNRDAPVISNYNLTFTLDKFPVNQSFMHTSDGSGQFQYNFSVLSLSGLPQTQHTFVMSALTGTNSTILFDYATYE
ncbi:hypothetical protein BDP27DRAFT_1247799 [Rhodocollybia butyracea]|uniref:Uncharacterized protein n=1 Tax=Rhodocollybia butyracea TaxID=206335 RepID=A0A9P5TVA4_9AGAR|nr:hypothetical protein BDP27DRAFT_1247799 [Rhodocollybia butyracea]